MPRSYYELLGRAVWKGGIWYMKRRCVPTRHGGGRVVAKRLGAGALVALAVGGAVVVAQRRGDHAS